MVSCNFRKPSASRWLSKNPLGPSPLPWRRRINHAKKLIKKTTENISPMSNLSPEDRWLIGLDIDGTLVHDDGYLSPEVAREVQRVRDLGHEVIIATGRAAANAVPVVRDLGIEHGFVVSSNGAVTVELDLAHPRGFTMSDVVTFDPAEVLAQLIEHLPEAHFAVEDVDGSYRFHRPFPTYALGDQNFETPLEELMHHPVSRVVVLSPQHDVDEFLGLISKIGLASVSYAIGYTAWLDISPNGVTKASALEKQRQRLGIANEQVLVMGDG
ncbi:MAG: HAD hydrolase family protein, partial [Actinobacteria bacterium]|nr:HAD hydrolase family protein [Actinomycetota bacterium]